MLYTRAHTAFVTTQPTTTADYPPKVQQVLRILRGGGWEPKVEVSDLGGRPWYWITAERYPGTLAWSYCSVSVWMGRGSGRLGTSRYYGGIEIKASGWRGVRRIAAMGPGEAK